VTEGPVTCGGNCCAVFTLSDQAQAKLADPDVPIQDERQIRAMIVPLSYVRARLRLWRLGMTRRSPLHRGMRGTLFTCRFWDRKTRRCRIYANRPRMCVKYPYGEACDSSATCTHPGIK
jgi:Fe-S-cluster containining protein